MEKDKEPLKEPTPKLDKQPPAPKDSAKEKRASQSQVLVPAILHFTTKEDLKGKGATQVKVAEVPAQTAAKANPPPSKTTQDFIYTLYFFMYSFCLLKAFF